MDFQRIALLGNPNSGKSSLFNVLTGLNQKVGNYPGVTVEKKVGRAAIGRYTYTLVDLPGTYSLYPNSQDERVVLDILLDEHNALYPDLILYLVDPSRLDTQLLLLDQVLELGIPLIVLVNMEDVLQVGDDEIERLRAFFSCPVYQVSTRDKRVADKIGSFLEEIDTPDFRPNADYIDYLHRANPSLSAGRRSDEAIDPSSSPIRLQTEDVMSRYQRIDPLVQSIDLSRRYGGSMSWQNRIETVLSHKFWGPLIFLFILTLIFNSIFSFAQMPMEWIDGAFANIQSLLRARLPAGWVADLIVDGLLAGLSGVVIFVPQIALLFFLLGLLEESGYMARVVYMFDGMMRRFGLNGRSLVALVSSGACAIPAVMSTRTIGNWKERLITILVSPFISCSARLPVYAVLISLVVVRQPVLMIWNTQGLVLLTLYVMGAVAALLSAAILSKLGVGGRAGSALMLELPDYRWPNMKNVLLDTWFKVYSFVVSAGKIIIVISMVLWALSSYGPSDDMRMAREEGLRQAQDVSSEHEANVRIATAELEASYIGHLGRFIEPAIQPLGFDWKIGIALLTSFAAREVFVGTMATIFSVSEGDDSGLLARMRAAENRYGDKIFTRATGLSLLVFYVFAMQCMSTLAVVRKETNSWKWPLLQFVGMTAIAYLASFLVFNIYS